MPRARGAWLAAGLVVAGRLAFAQDGSGGGSYFPRDHGPHLSDEQRRIIEQELRESMARLYAVGKLPPATDAPVPLAWPLAPANGLTDPGYHGISNFVDQNPAFPNQIRDYNCGTRTYDNASGYNHKGIDFFTWPFPFAKMDGNKVAVVAAAPGVIIFKADGNFDKNCSCASSNWNAVYVRHSNNSVAWYGHLKTGSLTPKPVGASVSVGEQLGIVGSSGCSTAPHLHLEIYDSVNALQEPYQGPCNVMNPTTWWISQRPYYDSAVNEMTTGPAPPVLPACPTTETPNEQTLFPRGATIYFTTYYRDQLSSQVSQYRIRRPDTSIYASWSHQPPSSYVASYWYWWYTNVAPTGPDGIWTFEVTYNGQTTTRPFTIGGSPSGRVPGDGITTPGMVATKSGANITLDWAASCMADTDYEVYEGTIGSFYSHASRICSTGGATIATLAPSSQSRYYLAVSRNATREGSYGKSSAGAERPVGTSPCLTRDIGACP